MALDTTDTTPLESREQLVAALEGGCKPKDQWRIGTEHEKFGFYKSDVSPVPYEGDNGIRALLKGMQQIDEAIGERIGLTRTGGSRDRNILK